MRRALLAVLLAGCGGVHELDAGADAGLDAGPLLDLVFPDGCQVRSEWRGSEGSMVVGAYCDSNRTGTYCADALSATQPTWLRCAVTCVHDRWADVDAGFCRCEPDGDGGVWSTPCYLVDGGSL